MIAKKSKIAKKLLKSSSKNDVVKATLIGSKNGLDKEGHYTVINGKPFVLKRSKNKKTAS